jgi:hypothetical protein
MLAGDDAESRGVLTALGYASHRVTERGMRRLIASDVVKTQRNAGEP